MHEIHHESIYEWVENNLPVFASAAHILKVQQYKDLHGPYKNDLQIHEAFHILGWYSLPLWNEKVTEIKSTTQGI